MKCKHALYHVLDGLKGGIGTGTSDGDSPTLERGLVDGTAHGVHGELVRVDGHARRSRLFRTAVGTDLNGDVH